MVRMNEIISLKGISRLDFQPFWESGCLSSSQLWVWDKERGLPKQLEIEPRISNAFSFLLDLELCHPFKFSPTVLLISCFSTTCFLEIS